MFRRITVVLLVAVAAVSRIRSGFAQTQPASNRKLIARVVPIYPDLARRMYLRGSVKLEAIVAPDGSVKSMHVIGGSPILSRAATDAVEKWKWAPASQESKELIELNFHPE